MMDYLSEWRRLAEEELKTLRNIRETLGTVAETLQAAAGVPPRYWTISFDDSIDPLSEKTIVSNQIPFPFEVVEMKFEFRRGAETLLEYKVFVSENDTAPSSGEPPGINVLSGYGHRDYIAAENAIVTVYHTYRVELPGWYVKLYVNNRDIFGHTVGAWITLRILGGR